MARSSLTSPSVTTSSCLSLYSSSSSGTLNASGLELADLDPPPSTKRARGEFFCLCYRCLLLMSLEIVAWCQRATLGSIGRPYFQTSRKGWPADSARAP